MVWEKVGTTKHGNGASEIRYKSGDYAVESRKRPIAHANGDGYWMYTSYFLIKPDGTEKEFMSLSAAKAAAEEDQR